MNGSGWVRGACVAAALCCFGLPKAEALEIVGEANPIAHMGEGMISKVYVARHYGVYRGPHGGVYRGGVYRGYGYRPGYRPGYWGGWARPGWYGWPAGGAIAAGAAIGVISAAAAASWAGPAPGPGLCWYYTDPSQRQGFWDACH